MRRKTITLDGAEFVISPLTLEQVDRYTTPIVDFEKMDTDAKRKSLRERSYQMICDALNNAIDPHGLPLNVVYGEGNREAPKTRADLWTPARIYKEIDLVTF